MQVKFQCASIFVSLFRHIYEGSDGVVQALALACDGTTTHRNSVLVSDVNCEP